MLYKGLNHHILPKKILGHGVKASIEKVFRRIVAKPNDDNENDKTHQQLGVNKLLKDEIRGVTRNFLNAAKHVCASKANQSFHKTLKALSTDSTIAVTRYDKGNGVCILDKEEYLKKLDQIVEDTTKFTIVQSKRKNARHPLYKRQDVVKKEIKTHLKMITDFQLERIRPSGCVVGKLYGSCKIHKADHPIRPIVSMVNTPEYMLAKYLDHIIKPYMPNVYSVTSNKEFLNRLNTFDHQDEDYCVSFDVVSLFTNVPLEETISLVANQLFEQNTTGKTPPMDKPGLISLLKTATGGIFSHRGQLYQQCDGVAMGNPLAPTLANFFLANIEMALLNNTAEEHHPAFYARYVDDVFCVFRKASDYTIFLTKLNTLHANLQFTCEIGGKSMPFLDTSVTLSPDGLKSSVFRKKTNTNVVLHYDATAPKAWKTGLIKCMLHRAEVVCSDDVTREEEHVKLKNIFANNGYPTEIFEKVKREFIERRRRQAESTKERNEPQESATVSEEAEPARKEFKHVLKIPYVGKISLLFSKRLRRLLQTVEENIRVVFKTTKVLESFRLKDPVPKEMTSRVVYQFQCRGDPDITYVGFTNRTLKERVKEHVSGTTSVSDHIAQCTVCEKEGVTIEDFKILKRCRNKWDTSIHEALLISEKNPILNRQLIKPGGKQFSLRIFN